MRIWILAIISFPFIYGCRHKPKTVAKTQDVTLVDLKEEPEDSLIPPPPPPALFVSAYLIYDDGSLSDFDVLHDRTKMLWNVIIGEGDAAKPSEKIKLVLHGLYDSITLKVKNGNRLVLNKPNISFNGKLEYIINNTGCEEVYVTITKKKSCWLMILFHLDAGNDIILSLFFH